MLTFKPMAAGSLTNAANRAEYLTDRDLTDDRLALTDYYIEGKGPGAEIRKAVRDAAEQHAGAEVLCDNMAAAAGKTEGNGSRLRANLHPKLAEALGVTPGSEVNDRELTYLLAGKRADGENLPGQERDISGYDLTWSADKSVSLAFAFAPTEAERAMILQAHKDAVEAAAQYVASQVGWARKGKDGRDGADQAEVAWIGFDHYTARPTAELIVADPETGKPATELHTLKGGVPGDPALHTHLFMLNLGLTAGGRAGSLDTMAFQGRIHEFGAYYQATLATNLRRIGAKVEMDRETGAARLVSVPKHISRAFSKRTNNAHEAAKEWAAKQGEDWDAMTDEGRAAFIKGSAKASRQGKRDDLEQMDAWRAQAKALRWQHKSILDEGPRLEPLPEVERTRVAYDTAQPLVAEEFKRRSVIAGYDLRAMAARGLIETGITGPDDISRVTLAFREHGVEQHGQRTDILWGEDRGHRGFVRVTTQLHADQEAKLIRLAKEAAADRWGDLRQTSIQEAVAQHDFDYTTEHGKTVRKAIDGLGMNGRLAVVIGSAGSAKTYGMLAPIVKAAQAEGKRAYGVALAWRQANALVGPENANVAKGDAMALEPFLRKAREGTLTLNQNTIVVLDELGQIGAKPMLDLLELREKHGFSIAAVGDDRQCASIDAGPVIDLFRTALGKEAIPQILTTIRQTTERERETATLFREGRAGDALERKRDDGTLEFVPGGHREAVARVAALWAERIAANAGTEAYTLTVSAPTNADAHAVSVAIREKRCGLGQVGETLHRVEATDQQAVTRHRLELAAGDRVRLFDRVWGKDQKTGRAVHVGNNGSVVMVLDADKKGMLVRTSAGREARVSWEQLSKHGNGRVRLAYGDCLTIDSAQGITSTEHIAAMPSGSQAVTGFKAYVAASRHRVMTFIVGSDGQERKEIVQRRPLGDQRPVTEKDVLDNMARNLSRQPEKMSALAFLERAVEIKRTAARGFQRGSQRMEARAARGKQPTRLRPAMQRRREEQVVSQAAEQIRVALDKLGKTAPSLTIAPPTPKAPSYTPSVVNSGKLPKPAQPRPEAHSYAVLAAARKAEQAVHVQEVREALRNNVEGVAERLLGKPTQRGGAQWRYGAKGSMSVVIRGAKRGMWRDHEAGQGGDMLGLIQRSQGISFVPALSWAREHLGMPEPQFGKALSAEDRAKIEAHLKTQQAKRAADDAAHEARKAARHETVARRAAIAWAGSKPAPADHPYLVAKGIEPHTARVDRRGRLRIAAMDANGKVWSLQHIDADGNKRFLKGGKMDGMMHVLGTPEPSKPIAFAEGFATAASVREATGLPVVVTYNVGNKEKVVADWRERNPTQTLIDAADNDHAKTRLGKINAGKDMAERLERDVGAVPALPPFQAHDKGSDWNDFAEAYGKEAAAEAFNAEIDRHRQKSAVAAATLSAKASARDAGMER